MMVHDYAYPIPYAIQGLGGYGLNLFFAISGVLICSRILEEEARIGRFDIKGFYIRRLLRIQPAAFVYLAVAALAPLVGISHEGFKYWFGAVFFYRNYLPHDVPPPSFFANGHFWTLAVEEHFYVILSLVLFFARRYRLHVMLLLLLSSFVWPAIEGRLGLFNRGLADHMTQDALKYLIWPAFLALLLQIPDYRAFAARYLYPGVVTLLACIFFALDHYHHAISHPSSSHWLSSRPDILRSDIDTVLTLFPFWIIATMIHPSSPLTRLLEWAPLRLIGRLSYSLYLWHVVFFLVRFGPTPQSKNHMPHFWLHAPWNYALSFLIASLSYRFVEKPLIRLGHKLAPPATPGREDLQSTSISLPAGVPA